jgi:hypothetical protein
LRIAKRELHVLHLLELVWSASIPLPFLTLGMIVINQKFRRSTVASRQGSGHFRVKMPAKRPLAIFQSVIRGNFFAVLQRIF